MKGVQETETTKGLGAAKILSRSQINKSKWQGTVGHGGGTMVAQKNAPCSFKLIVWAKFHFQVIGI